MQIKQAAIKGLTWHATSKLASKSISIIRLILIARILSPSDLGQAGLAFLILSFIEIATETGLAQAAIQHTSDLTPKLTSLWIVSVSRGVLISLILFALAQPLAIFFHSPVTKLIQAAALIPLIRGFTNPNIISLQRNLAFRREGVYQFILSAFEHITAVVLAYYLKTPIALIYASIFGVIFSSTTSYLIVKSYWLKFNLNTLKQLFSYGRWVTAGSIASYLNDQIDDFTVAKLLTDQHLGYYQTAYKVSNLPTTQGAGLIYQVFFPIFSNIKTQKQKLNQLFKKVMLISLALSFSLTSAIIIISPWFTRQFLGEKWLPIIPAIYIFSAFAFVRSNTSVASALFDATGKPSVVFAGNIIKLTALAVLILPFTISHGYLGAAASVSLAQLAVVPWFTYKTRQALS